MHFVSRLFNLPLIATSDPKGLYTEEELYSILALIFITVFLDYDPVKTFPMRQAAKTVSEQLCKLIETNVGSSTGWGIKGWFSGGGDRKYPELHGSNLIKGWSKDDMSAYDIASGQILPIIASIVPSQGMLVRQCLLSLWSMIPH